MSARGGLLLAIAAVVLITLALGLRSPAVPVEHALVERAPLQAYVEEDVQTQVRSSQLIAVPLPGTLSAVTLRPGDSVAAGQVLAELAPVPATPLDSASRGRLLADRLAAQSLAAAAAEGQRLAAATLVQIEREAERAQRLREEEVISLEQAEREQIRLQQAQADAAAASAHYRAALAQVQAISALLQPGAVGSEAIAIRSYQDGVVLRRMRESPGPAAAGEPLLEIGNPQNLEIVGELLSADAVRLSPGNAVSFSQWGGDRSLHGVVDRIEPAGYTKRSALGVEEQRVRVITVPDPADAPWPALGDGYRLRGRYTLWSGDEVLQVNAGAIQRDRDGWSVLRIVDGRAQRQSVQIGQRNDQAVQILQGLSEGDRVVVYADDRVDDGARVDVVR